MFARRKPIVMCFLIVSVLVGCDPGGEAETNQVTDTAVEAVEVEPTDTQTPLPTETPLPTDEPSRDSGATVFRDIYYTTSKDKSQSVSAFFPEEAASFPDKKYPVIFLAHGWTLEKEGAEGDIMHEVITFVNDLGYAAVSIDYRDDRGSDPWVALGDSACALAWVFANADDYGLDVNQMVAFGHSWGGTMTSVLAGADEVRDFLQDCPHQLPEGRPFLGTITYGIDTGVPGPGLDFGSEEFAEDWEKWLTYGRESKDDFLERSQVLSQVPPLEWADNESFTEEERRLAMLFPVYCIDPGDPPSLVMYGEKEASPESGFDPTIEGLAYVELLESVGVPATFVLIPGAFHSWFGSDELAWQEPMGSFLDDLLANE
jgi:acetyl esterase/lipase